jgi:osomolarity two-component system, response regulator SKN7
MPKLDGVSATSLIRTFDFLTPIISVTGSSQPSDVMKYFSSGAFCLVSFVVHSTWTNVCFIGMTDVLPKPYTKDQLHEMLQKYLGVRA